MLGPARSGQAVVVPNAIPDEAFDDSLSKAEARQTLGWPIDATIVGVPGTLRPKKGHEFFFRAVAGLHSEHPGLLFAVTGGGENQYVLHLTGLVAQLGLQKQVIFTGVLDGLYSFYRACDVICVPSDAESFGRVVIEAFAAAVPVVATAVGGIPEIVQDGVDGLLVPCDDEVALRSALHSLLNDSSRCAALSSNARNKAERDYREVTYQARVAEVVGSLVAAHGG
jgi:glycosyltransferase involved in cell wall biosynthesis